MPAKKKSSKSAKTSKTSKSSSLLPQQLTVLSLGLPLIALAIAFCFYYPLDFIKLDVESNNLLSRVFFGLRLSALSIIPLLVGIQVVANQRLFSKQINPITGGKPSHTFQINSRYVSNTAEQFLILFIGTMAGCATISIDIKLIFVFNILFIIGRILFWIGYHIEPTKRAAGMGLTFFSTYSLVIYSSYMFIKEFIIPMF